MTLRPKEIDMQTSIPEGGVPERSLRDLYYVLFRHRRKIFLFFAAVVVTVTVGTFMSPEIYRSEAKLLVRLGRESVSLDPTATTGQIVNVGQSEPRSLMSPRSRPESIPPLRSNPTGTSLIRCRWIARR